MPERLVLDTGPLITLARIDCLDIVGNLPYEFLCPEEVRRELDEGEVAGHPRVAPGWLSVLKLSSSIHPAAVFALDEGEAAVIQLALELKFGIAVIDEWKGRRAALAAGLEVTGSLGLLGQAKLRGLIPAIRPLIERAVAEGIRYHPDLVRAVLTTIGE